MGGQLLDKRIDSLAAVGAIFPVIVWKFVLKINISLSLKLDTCYIYSSHCIEILSGRALPEQVELSLSSLKPRGQRQ